MLFSSFIASLSLFSTTGWAGYVLQDDYFDGSFFDKFDFFADEDPTHGFVTYKNYDACIEEGLISNSSSSVMMKVDDTNVTPNGRPSVRISSKNTYNTALIVLDLEHMPGSICGLWPAFWTLGPDWPNNGEIDIIEGVSCSTSNAMTLHTGPGCDLDSSSSSKAFAGDVTSTTCVSGGDSNTGCQIATNETNTYGSGFNAGKGGIYAMEWTTEYISIWFFPRGSYPDDVLGDSPDPSGWGIPLSNFRLSCNIATSFQDHQIVFDTTFCGDWAGNAWAGDSQCSSKADTCNSYVQNNPEAFAEAYWSVNALKVYQESGGSSPSSPSTYGTPSSTPASVAQPTSTYEPESTSAPPYITSSPAGYGNPTSSADAGGQTSWGGYSPVVGPGGSVGESSPPPSTTSWGGWWSNNADGTAEWNDGGQRVRMHRHARHLRQHKRHHGKGL